MNFGYSPSAFAADTDHIYVGDGQKLYSIDPATNTPILKKNFPYNINSVTPAGNYLFVKYNNYTAVLLNKADFTTLSTLTPSNYYYSACSTIYVDSQKRVYENNDNSINYWKIDPASSTISDYKINGSLGVSANGILRQFGNELKLVTGSGNIFSIDENNASAITYVDSIGETVNEWRFLPSCMLIAENRGDAWSNKALTTLSCLNTYTPYSAVNTIANILGEATLGIIPTDDGALLITYDSNYGIVYNGNDPVVHIHSYTLAELTGSSSKGIGSVSAHSRLWEAKPVLISPRGDVSKQP